MQVCQHYYPCERVSGVNRALRSADVQWLASYETWISDGVGGEEDRLTKYGMKYILMNVGSPTLLV